MADKTRREEAASLLQKLQDISSIVGKIEAQRSAGKARCVAEPTTQAPRLVLPSSSPTPASLNVLETAGGALADGAASLLDQWGLTRTPTGPACQQKLTPEAARTRADPPHAGCLHQ